MDACEVHKTNTEFWSTIGSDFLGSTALPSWGGFFPSEDKLHLLGSLSGKKVLEIGCGNGRSLKYAADQSAAELWGLDISVSQIERTEKFLKGQGIPARLVCSPMEEKIEILTDRFDVIYSVYGIGWTTDLNQTLLPAYSFVFKKGRRIYFWVVASNSQMRIC